MSYPTVRRHVIGFSLRRKIRVTHKNVNGAAWHTSFPLRNEPVHEPHCRKAKLDYRVSTHRRHCTSPQRSVRPLHSAPAEVSGFCSAPHCKNVSNGFVPVPRFSCLPFLLWFVPCPEDTKAIHSFRYCNFVMFVWNTKSFFFFKSRDVILLQRRLYISPLCVSTLIHPWSHCLSQTKHGWR